jgi:hypothetical protein
VSDVTLAKRIADLREKAARCRLAAGSADPATAATLKAYALELEADAARLGDLIQSSPPELPAQAIPQDGNVPHTGQAAAALKAEVPAETGAGEPGNLSAS